MEEKIIENNLQSILKNLHGEKFISILEEHSINEESLKFITKSHLDVIIPRSRYGEQIIFEHHLKIWQQQQFASDNPSVSHNNSIFELPIPKTSVSEVSVLQILSESLNGKYIMEYYANKNALNSKYRRILSNCITEYLLENNVKTSPQMFDSFANEISTIFPNESKDIYFIKKAGRKPAGCLYSKYHNSIGKLRKEGLWAASTSVETVKEIQDEPVVNSGIENNDVIYKEWLKYNVEPFDEILEKWSATFHIRQKCIREICTLNDLLEEWPLFKQSFGYKLIVADFTTKYPGKENLLFEKWESFSKSISKLMEKKISNADKIELLNKLSGSDISSENRALIILNLIHEVLKPSTRICTIDIETKKRNFHKTTVADSRNSFLLWAPTITELQSQIKLKIDRLFENRETLQPIVCGIGKSSEEFSDVFIFYANIFYKLNNIIQAIDVGFKIFQILDLKYPHDCQTVWRFIQCYFYEIPLKNNEKDNILITVLNNIKNF